MLLNAHTVLPPIIGPAVTLYSLWWYKCSLWHNVYVLIFWCIYIIHNHELLCIAAILYIHIQPGWDLSVRVMWMAVMKYLAMKEWIVSMFRPQARVQCVDPAQWDSLEMDRSVWVWTIVTSNSVFLLLPNPMGQTVNCVQVYSGTIFYTHGALQLSTSILIQCDTARTYFIVAYAIAFT